MQSKKEKLFAEIAGRLQMKCDNCMFGPDCGGSAVAANLGCTAAEDFQPKNETWNLPKTKKEITFCRALAIMEKEMAINEKWNKSASKELLDKYQQGFRSGFISALNALGVDDPKRRN